MAKQGWIKVYRKITDSLVWSDPNLLKMWILCLTKANHDQSSFNFNGKKIILNSGQFVTGRTAISNEYNYGSTKRHQISAISAWRLLKKLESMEMLNIKTTTKYSVVTVIRWGDYQETEQQLDNNPTSTRQQPDTNKNDKNEENEKKSSTTIENNSAVNSFQNNIGFLAPITLEKMNDRISDFEQLGASNDEANNIIIKAIEIAVSRNKRSFGYVEGILKPWLDKNLNSVAVIEAEENQYQQSKLAHGNRGTARKPKQFQNFEQNDDQYDDLPF